MVVDFAVERDRRVAVFAHHRLIAARQVDDLQPHGAQRRQSSFEDALLVRPAMRQSVDDALRDTSLPRLPQTCKSRNPAHLRYNPRSPKGTDIHSVMDCVDYSTCKPA